MSQSPARIVTTVLAVPVVVLNIWWLLDRAPPYTRSDGQIVAADPASCGLAETAPRGRITGGACNAVNWKITPLRNCKPHGQFNVVRTIKDAQGLHMLPPIDSRYDPEKYVSNPLVRFFVQPLNSPAGPARYDVSACFACNPGQEFLPGIYRPVCVNDPGIDYDVEMATPAMPAPAGPAGERGSQGSQGPQGEPGPQGPRGP